VGNSLFNLFVQIGESFLLFKDIVIKNYDIGREKMNELFEKIFWQKSNLSLKRPKCLNKIEFKILCKMSNNGININGIYYI